MSHPSRIAYWRASVAESMEGMHIALTSDQLDAIAESLAISAENESLALGYDAIPNPLAAEVEELRHRAETQQERACRAECDLNDSEAVRADWERRGRRAETLLEQAEWDTRLGRPIRLS